jgi:hypothetical protein
MHIGEYSMNIWIEYWKRKDIISGSHAQMRENPPWVPPDRKDVDIRYCQSREEANRIARNLNDEGYHVIIKTDGAL